METTARARLSASPKTPSRHVKKPTYIGLPALLLSALLLSGCLDSDDDDSNTDASNMDPNSTSAMYSATFTAKLTNPEFGAVPAGGDFTTLVGAAVNTNANLWRPGELATPGFEALAELGRTTLFRNQIEQAISDNAALNVVMAMGTKTVETRKFSLQVNQTYPRFTFATMIGPTPDWIVGLSAYNLQNENGQWKTDVTIELPVYDGGTEDGMDYSLDNPQTNPQQPIELLQGPVEGNAVFVDGFVDGNAPASIRFERVQ